MHTWLTMDGRKRQPLLAIDMHGHYAVIWQCTDDCKLPVSEVTLHVRSSK